MNTIFHSNNTFEKHSKRVRIIAWLNFLFGLLHIVFTYGASSSGYVLQGVVFFASAMGLFFGGYYLLKKKAIGKTLTRISALMDILLLIFFVCRNTIYFFDPVYSFGNVLESVIYAFWLYLFRGIYPIVAGFIVLNKTNDELGLE